MQKALRRRKGQRLVFPECHRVLGNMFYETLFFCRKRAEFMDVFQHSPQTGLIKGDLFFGELEPRQVCDSKDLFPRQHKMAPYPLLGRAANRSCGYLSNETARKTIEVPMHKSTPLHTAGLVKRGASLEAAKPMAENQANEAVTAPARNTWRASPENWAPMPPMRTTVSKRAWGFRAQYKTLNPFRLKQELDKKLDQFFEALEKENQRAVA